MRIEMHRTFPVPRKVGFDFITDFHHWPEWISMDLVEDKKAAWGKKGDKVPFMYKSLGVPVKGLGELEKIVPGEMVIAEFEAGPLPETEFELHFENAGAHAFTLTFIAEAELPEGWLGKSMEMFLMLKPFYMREMRLMLDKLDKVFLAMHEGTYEEIAA